VIVAEGWYLDPFGRHEHRWFSNGHPTALVRDGVIDGHDEPPALAWDGPLQELEEIPALNETLRADDDPEQQLPPDEAGHLM